MVARFFRARPSADIGKDKDVTDIFTEVDEDLRHDRALKLWKRFAPYVAVGALAVVALTAGVIAWRDYDRRQAEADAARFLAAADLVVQGESQRAAQSFAAIARDGRAGYAALARFNEAALKARGGDGAGALALYKALGADSGLAPELRQAAEFLAIQDAAATASAAEVERSLGALGAPTSPWRGLALELVAAAALRTGDSAKAREVLAQIADDATASQAIRARAAEMLAALGS